jgi:hypothetical protein
MSQGISNKSCWQVPKVLWKVMADITNLNRSSWKSFCWSDFWSGRTLESWVLPKRSFRSLTDSTTAASIFKGSHDSFLNIFLFLSWRLIRSFPIGTSMKVSVDQILRQFLPNGAFKPLTSAFLFLSSPDNYFLWRN